MDTQYIADRKVKSVEDTGEFTPGKVPMVKVTYTTGEPEVMSHKRFLTMMSRRPSDATKARNELIVKAGQEIYALLVEYGVKLGEVRAIVDSVKNLVLTAEDRATTSLWGVQVIDEIGLLDVNKVLLKNGNFKQEDSGDGASSEGSTTDSANSGEVPVGGDNLES